MSDKYEWNWEDFDDPEEVRPDYENAIRIDFTLWSDSPGVQQVVGSLTSGWGGNARLNRACMMVMVLNLYRCYKLNPEKWVIYVRRKGNYKLVPKYNPNRVTYTGLIRAADALIAEGSVDHALGFYYRNQAVESGKCSRIKAKRDFIHMLERDYGFDDSVVRYHPDKEVILLKDEDKNLIHYDDNTNNQAERMRRIIRQYNRCLEETYIDLDIGDFRVSRENQQQHVALFRKQVYRVFNNGKVSLVDGGRLYGGFWEEIPSALRLKIIINNMKVIECDYSGIHIHLLYAREGIDFGRYGKDAYQLPEYDDTPKMRQVFKDLLLIAINAENEKEAIAVMKFKFKLHPEDYPDNLPNLEEAIQDFREYHKPISKYFFKGVGLKLMKIDSDIAIDVVYSMVKEDIPVLSVHDSFICPKLHEETLIRTMKQCYQKHCGYDVTKALSIRRPNIKIKHDEHDRNIEYPVWEDEEYYYDLNYIQDEDLIRRIIDYDREGTIAKYVELHIKCEGRS